MKIIIAGGRDFTDYDVLSTNCDQILKEENFENVEIISGMAKGADTLALQYAKNNNFIIHEFPADWNTYGKKAGYLRNSEMAKNGDVLIAFWDGKSKGTKNMIEIAKKQQLRVFVINY